MAIIKRRSRIVSFRLSPEEYQAMKERCITEGARSISDFARASACRSASAAEQQRKELETRDLLQKLQQCVEDFDRKVVRLNQTLNAFRESELLVESMPRRGRTTVSE